VVANASRPSEEIDFRHKVLAIDYNIKVIGRTVPRKNYLRCLYVFLSPLHVSALVGYLQVEYAIIFGKYLTTKDAMFLCYRSYFVYGLANNCSRLI
jgi:hypothetical protein